MTQTQFIERIGTALYSGEPGWMSRLARGLKISPGYLNNLHKGVRPLTPALLEAIKQLLVTERSHLVDKVHVLRDMITEIKDLTISQITLGPEPEPHLENELDDDPAPGFGG